MVIYPGRLYINICTCTCTSACRGTTGLMPPRPSKPMYTSAGRIEVVGDTHISSCCCCCLLPPGRPASIVPSSTHTHKHIAASGTHSNTHDSLRQAPPHTGTCSQGPSHPLTHRSEHRGVPRPGACRRLLVAVLAGEGLWLLLVRWRLVGVQAGEGLWLLLVRWWLGL